nr:hypothetical protein [Tanacetum cinerariifolium]
NTGGQNVARACTAGNNDQRGYDGTFPYCIRSFMDVTTQGTLGLNQKVVTCFECEAQGNYRKNYPKVKNQNRENKSRVPDARGKAYVLGGGDANPGSNIVTEYHRVCDMRHASALDFASRESQTSAILVEVEVEIEHSLDVRMIWTASASAFS